MYRLISSFLVFMLGAAASPARGARARTVLRPRLTPDDEGAADRSLETTERPRARSRQFRRSWPGSVELVHDTHTVQVPGTWTLDHTSFHRRESDAMQVDALPLPHIGRDSAAWAERMRTVLSLQEPGTRLRVGAGDPSGWRTLEMSIPTRPLTIIEVDREALGSLLNGAVAVRLRIDV